ncbi:YihY/virulence factor BrkB family protein [Variovorax sp. VNK109]|uniref:YihY/virulence factor BrkB family protein n=1 Tax=Variovorax sp. VNK109 TaxID=3400919 RepID=UPI003BFF87A1
MHIRRFIDLSKKSVNAWLDDDASSMGASIAYYTVFSIAPLLVIVIAVAGAVWGREAVQGEIVGQLTGLVGAEAASTIQKLLQSATLDGGGLIATLLGLGALLIGSTSAFVELQRALDRIWRQPSTVQRKGLWNMLRSRVLSFGLILGLAFLLIVSLVASAALAAVGRWTQSMMPGTQIALQLLNLTLSLGVTTILFASIYKLMPTARIAWRDVWTGAAVTAVLFEAGKFLIGMYLGHSSVTSSFGAAGSLAVLLLWVYYSAQIFLLGAEFTWVYASQHGSLAKRNADRSAAISSGPSVSAP